MEKKVIVFVLADASDPTLDSPPVSWAIGHLKESLQDKGRWYLELYHTC